MMPRILISSATGVLLTLSGCAEIGSIASMAQAPVSLRLTAFLVFNGYYVNLRNTSEEALSGVSLTYYDSEGNTVSQHVGTILPHQTIMIDPSEVNCRVTRHEKIAIHADNYIRRVVETNVLIDQLE